MKKEDDLKIFIPKSVSVGKFAREAKAGKTVNPNIPGGIVSCRFKNNHWLHVSIFERLTGYKPNVQRDSAAQLKKTVLDTVNEFENVPTSGFKLNGWDENIYRYSFTRYNVYGDIIIEDPRGFVFGMAPNLFFSFLADNGMTLTNGKIDGEFVYGWSCIGCDQEITLIRVGTDEYKKNKKLSDDLYEEEKAKMITPKQLQYGHVYHAANVLHGNYVYLGSVDTYSERCHLDAFENRKYNFDKACADEAVYIRTSSFLNVFPTSTGKHVFYSLDYNSSKNGSMPYIVRTSINRIFDVEVDYPAGDKLSFMYNDSKKRATLKNIEADMRVSPCFNRIDFSADCKYEPMSFDMFEHIFGVTNMRNIKLSEREINTFPFTTMYYKELVKTENTWLKITPYDVFRHSLRSSWLVQDVFRKQAPMPKTLVTGNWYSFSNPAAADGVRYKNTTCLEIYNKYKPLVPVLHYENGERVREEFASFLKPGDAVYAMKHQ